MIPQFPLTKKLELSDRGEIENYVRQFPPYSDFNFVSLWCYDTDHLAEVSWLYGNLVIKFQDYIDLEMFYTFLGKNNCEETIDVLLTQAQKEGSKSHLKLVPQISLESVFDSPHYNIEEDQDNFDYMIASHQFGHMEGSVYHKKRNMVSHFLRDYGNIYEFKSIDLKNWEIQKEIVRLFHVWEHIFQKNPEESAHELSAIMKLFEGLWFMDLVSFGIYVKGELVAFLISEFIQDKTALRHFEKPDVHYHGITEILQKESAIYFERGGYEYINYEQDLGLPGLREAKTLCHPVFFLKKYKVFLR